MSVKDLWLDFGAIVYMRPHCGKPQATALATADDIKNYIVTTELTGDTALTGTSDWTKVVNAQGISCTLRPTNTVVENGNDICGGEKCIKATQEWQIDMTINNCQDGETIGQFFKLSELLTGQSYEVTTDWSYAKSNFLQSWSLCRQDILLLKCNDATGKYFSAKMIYGTYLDEGAEFIDTFQKFETTGEFQNTEISIKIPSDACILDFIIPFQGFIDYLANCTDQTPWDYLTASGFVEATPATTPTPLKAAKTEVKAVKEQKKSK